MHKTADLIKQLMDGYTIKQISDMTGYHENTISQWRRGLNEPPFYAMRCVAQVCGYQLEFIKNEQRND